MVRQNEKTVLYLHLAIEQYLFNTGLKTDKRLMGIYLRELSSLYPPPPPHTHKPFVLEGM